MSLSESASKSHENTRMKTRVSTAAAAAFGLACVASAGADETSIRLKDGPELASVNAYCSICHSTDYIEMNSRFLERAAWEAEVTKMIKIMGAPIPDSDVPRIVDYLIRNYGVE
jgi:cytochrome c5